MKIAASDYDGTLFRNRKISEVTVKVCMRGVSHEINSVWCPGEITEF